MTQYISKPGPSAKKSVSGQYSITTLSPFTYSPYAGDSKYCDICTPPGTDCPGRLAISSDWAEEGDNTKIKEQEQSEASPNLAIMPTQTLQPHKPYISKYFDNMSSDPPIIYTPKDNQRCNIIVAQQELKTTVNDNLEQDSLEDIG